MKEVQLDIFTINDNQKIDKIVNSIKDKLSKYGIDELYRKQFKGQTPLLREIYETLSKKANYEDYMKDLISELLKIVPLLNSKNMFQETGIFEYESRCYGYTVGKYIIDGIPYLGCQCPLYCLDMLPKHFFKELIK